MRKIEIYLEETADAYLFHGFYGISCNFFEKAGIGNYLFFYSTVIVFYCGSDFISDFL